MATPNPAMVKVAVDKRHDSEAFTWRLSESIADSVSPETLAKLQAITR